MEKKIERRGLGRGLSALMADINVAPSPVVAVAGPGRTPDVLPIERIKPNPLQPRKDFDADALQALADKPYRIGSHERDELAPGLRSYHLTYSRQQARHPHGTVKSPRHIEFYRVANDEVFEVGLLHDTMEVQLHLPND